MLFIQHSMRAATSSGRGSCFFLIEAFPANNRPTLGGAEWHCSVLAALGAGGSGLHARVVASVAGIGGGREHGHALGLTGFTALGLVLKLLVMEKQLFPGRKDKLAAAVDAG